MSTTEGIITMSRVPIYGRMSRAAIVETITLGTPIGRACMAVVAIEVPAPPPAETIACSCPRAHRFATMERSPVAIVSNAASRLPARFNLRTLEPPARAT